MSRLTSAVLVSLVVAALPAAAQAKKLSAPAVAAPADGATVEAFPAFTWKPVRHADRYQVQIAADARFTAPLGIFGASSSTTTTTATAVTASKSASDGTYYWRVRALTPAGSAGRWSKARKLTKAWTTPPTLQGPDGLTVSWPGQPLLLRWTPVPHAVKYRLSIATDPGMTNLVVGTSSSPRDVVGTVYAASGTLTPGTYYWTVTPLDAEGFAGQTSAIGRFDWSWPTATTLSINDLDPDPRVFDPQFSWQPVPGAARYEVEINGAQDFAPNSKWCCSDKVIGTSLSPQHVLANNNGYYARVRAYDVDGNAGAWNVFNGGGTFAKGFDDVTPTIPDLRLGDTTSDDLGAGATTDTPVVRWDAVPGANEYEIQTVAFVNGSGCSYTNPHVMHTASLAWTPLGSGTNTNYPPQTDGSDPDAPATGSKAYCLRVRALSDDDAQGHEVHSDWTNLGDNVTPAFQFAAQPDPGPTLATTQASDYLTPTEGSANVRTPLFTWKPIAGAHSYLVVVARDAQFTNIADAAITEVPAYAPRRRGSGAHLAAPLTDETTSYYWAVFPSSSSNASTIFSEYAANSPRTFEKNSTPPTPLGPQTGADVAAQPTFRWTEAEGARNYRLQVAADPTFSQMLDDVTTDSTAYTTLSTYPADTPLYWRVRGNDVNGNGLNWSPTGTFTRRLPTPAFLPRNPTAGSGLPVFAWAPVDGAIGYDMHADNGDGTSSNGTTRSTAFAPREIWGTGVFHYKVRAIFPSGTTGTITGPYTDLQAFTRTFGPVSGVNALRSRYRVLLSWDGYTGAKSYQAAISTTDSFDHTIASVRTDGTVWAPDMKNSPGGRLYYRVAPVDTHGSNGAATMGSFTLPKIMRVQLLGVLVRGQASGVTITATDAGGRPVRHGKVTITGAGMRTRRARLDRRGRLAIKLRAPRRGNVTILVRRKGYADGAAITSVR